ncbi:MAG TPA: aldose 1-epimerase family protein [Armatimonadota bacterium]|nr:aldose 1-epimerase family protein [Armatimonadota bacterium]
MPKLYGKDYSKKELLARVGDISQIAGVRLCTLADGVEHGVRAVDFRTGSGLDFSVLVDRGLDISTAAYKGQPLAWRSSTGDVSPALYEEPGFGWLRSFYGGLLVTCGLTYAGAPSVDKAKALGLHGRVSNLPASHVSADAAWQDDEYIIWACGRVRETAVFGENVELQRCITARLGEPRIWICDRVTNLGYQETEHMILYHMNIGFPVIDEGSRLIAPVKSSRPRDADAEMEKELYASFPAPAAGFRERVYYLDMAEAADGTVTAALVNPDLNSGEGFGMYVKYPKRELPKFSEWKMTGEGTYVVGLEPGNCWVEGRPKERELGTLQFLSPGESREYRLEIGVLSSKAEIAGLEEDVRLILDQAK